MKPLYATVTLFSAVCLSFNSFYSFSQCLPAPVVPVYTPARIAINENETVEYTVSNAVVGYFYEVIDLASGEPIGQGVWATTYGTLSLITDPFIITGTYTIYIRTTFLLGATQCTVNSAYGTVIVNPVVLPFKLVQFRGKKQGSGILLEWETANQDQPDHFEIERSVTGSVYTNIGRVTQTGQSHTGNNYSFIDTHPSFSVNYYRLKMVDLDGKAAYSNTILIRFTGSLKANILPNPFSEAFIVQVTLERKEVLNIRLIDAAGTLISKKEVNAHKGNNTIPFNELSALPEGCYFLQLRNAEDMIQQKMVKINR